MDEKRVRLQKFLAERGVASRRAAEGIIAAGRVTVNGRTVTEMGVTITPGQDLVSVDGRPLESSPERTRIILLNKPRGYVCSRNSQQGRTVFELLEDIPERLVCVGRLDKGSEGLLVLSNDGELVQRLTHPRHGHRKVYKVTVSGTLGERELKRLNQPMEIDGYRIRPARVRKLDWNETTGRTILEFTLQEGRNRQIRKMCERVNLQVHRLTRVSIESLSLGKLPAGKWRELTPEELAELSP